jgi:hypothetical protein
MAFRSVLNTAGRRALCTETHPAFKKTVGDRIKGNTQVQQSLFTFVTHVWTAFALDAGIGERWTLIFLCRFVRTRI